MLVATPKTSGTIIIAVLTALFLFATGLIYIIAGYSYYITLFPSLNQGFESLGPHQFSESLPEIIVNLFGGVSSFLLGILSMVSGIGLVLFKRWGYKLVLLTFFVTLIYICVIPALITFGINQLLLMNSSVSVGKDLSSLSTDDYMIVVVSITLMFYFLRPSVRRQFGDHHLD